MSLGNTHKSNDIIYSQINNNIGHLLISCMICQFEKKNPQISIVIHIHIKQLKLDMDECGYYG